MTMVFLVIFIHILVCLIPAFMAARRGRNAIGYYAFALFTTALLPMAILWIHDAVVRRPVRGTIDVEPVSVTVEPQQSGSGNTTKDSASV